MSYSIILRLFGTLSSINPLFFYVGDFMNISVKIDLDNESIMYFELENIFNSVIIDNDIFNNDASIYNAIKYIFGNGEELDDIDTVKLEEDFNQDKDLFKVFLSMVYQMVVNYINDLLKDIKNDIVDDIDYYEATIDGEVFDYEDCIRNYSEIEQMKIVESNLTKLVKLDDYLEDDIFYGLIDVELDG